MGYRTNPANALWTTKDYWHIAYGMYIYIHYESDISKCIRESQLKQDTRLYDLSLRLLALIVTMIYSPGCCFSGTTLTAASAKMNKYVNSFYQSV